MKKIIALLLISLIALSGCGSDEAISQIETAAAAETESEGAGQTSDEQQEDSGKVVEISEKLFISQINDIYLNTSDYLGSTIKYEGILDAYYWEATDTTYYQVIRYGPGCCGNDGVAGFEVVWDGEYPEADEWVEVVGVLEKYEEDGYQNVRIRISSLNVMDKRGSEYVEA